MCQPAGFPGSPGPGQYRHSVCYTPSVVRSLAQKSQQAPSLSEPWPFSTIPNICAQPLSHAHTDPEPQSQPTIHDLRPQHPNHRDLPRFLPITDTPASSPPHTSTRGPTHHLSETRLVLGGRSRPCLSSPCMLTELPTCPLTASALILVPHVPHGSPWPPGLPSPCHPPPPSLTGSRAGPGCPVSPSSV